jgi:hypothetical protein
LVSATLVGEFSLLGIISVEIMPLLLKDSGEEFKVSEYGQTRLPLVVC